MAPRAVVARHRGAAHVARVGQGAGVGDLVVAGRHGGQPLGPAGRQPQVPAPVLPLQRVLGRDGLVVNLDIVLLHRI